MDEVTTSLENNCWKKENGERGTKVEERETDKFNVEREGRKIKRRRGEREQKGKERKEGWETERM